MISGSGGEGGISHYNGLWTAYGTAAGMPTDQVLGDVHAFANDVQRNRLWAGTDTGLLLVWEGNGWVFVADLRSPILALAQVDGELWVGTRDGAYRFNGVDALLIDVMGRQPVNALLSTENGV